jgi:C-terminal processing protease CtpA/Prc
MAPHSAKEYTFPIGTQIYLANSEQVSYSMSGNNIQKRGDKPDLVVRKEDDGKNHKAGAVTLFQLTKASF